MSFHSNTEFYFSEYPTWVIMRPAEFRKRFFDGTLDTFDHIFTYSSLEHSGLGRYGDPLNPWGDIMAVAEAWCVAKPNAKLALGLPTSVSAGYDHIQFNAGRIYGPILYPFLVIQLIILYTIQMITKIFRPQTGNLFGQLMRRKELVQDKSISLCLSLKNRMLNVLKLYLANL